MCDVLAAMPDATEHGKVLFGKNSDRPARECQPLYFSSGGPRPGGSQIQCSYVAVPEVGNVLSTLGCRPYWCWGYETGMNEAGVAGGNVAVFTKGHDQDRGSPGLTGMELLRLGLERGRSAEEVVDAIAALLVKYGQWGSAVQGKDHESGGYDNGFLLVDRKEGWVLETSGRRWVAERFARGVRSISNQLSIRTRWDKGSTDLKEFAHRQGWWSPGTEFDFALAYTDHKRYSRQVSHIRWKRSGQLLRSHRGHLHTAAMMRFLRDHYEDTFLEGPQFNRFLPDFLTLCMHDSPAGFTWGNTASSVVIEMDPHDPSPPLYWLCYLPPCSGVYSAFYLGATLPEEVTAAGTAGTFVGQPADAPKDTFSESSLWWRFNRLLEEAAKQPERRPVEMRKLFDAVESLNLAEAEKLMTAPQPERRKAFDQWIPAQFMVVRAAIEDLENRWNLAGKSPASEVRHS